MLSLRVFEWTVAAVESEQNESRYDLSPAQHQYCLYINGIFHSYWFPLPWVLPKSSSFIVNVRHQFLDVFLGVNDERNYVPCIKFKEVIGNNTSIQGNRLPCVVLQVRTHGKHCNAVIHPYPLALSVEEESRDSRGCSDCRRRCLLEYIIIHEQSQLGVCLTALLILPLPSPESDDGSIFTLNLARRK